MNHPLLRYLRCPRCNKSLKNIGNRLTCRRCRSAFPVRRGIPILVDLKHLPQHLKQQIEYFEQEDKTRGSFVLEPWQKRYVDNFIKASPKPGGLVIDCATGSGYMAIELAKLGLRVIATDLTLTELVKLQKNVQHLKVSDRVLCVCANSEDLPIQTRVADGLVANAILEHLPHEKKAVAGLRRILKPQAVLMVAMPIDLRYIWPFLWLVNILHDRRIGHLRRYTRERTLRLFPGFSEISTYYTGSIGKICCMIVGWHEWGEKIDSLTARFPYGSSNIVSILQKK